MEEKIKTLQECEKDLLNVTVKDFYWICFEYQREGRMGIIRFPKRIRDLYRELTGDYGSNKAIITSQLVDIINNRHLQYCDKKIVECSDEIFKRYRI